MKRNNLELLNLYGFHSSKNGLGYLKELIAPSNPNAKLVIGIVFVNGKWCINNEYIRISNGKEYQDGYDHYEYKSLKVCINRLAKDCELYGFKKIA